MFRDERFGQARGKKKRVPGRSNEVAAGKQEATAAVWCIYIVA